ncbi:hypothetical protein KTN05_16770 [Paracoccus sp. Z118]|uniref:hypothetical protein n=1 Tax=Paracoccus sp. Z118 TaxID=2851017 RepID=UPI001C2B8161|nr:hypothetical protein [Paracoccus sp. Z118]MBV0893456.1 hypothetical protein [Paracoccus sp. Z118]
MTPLTLSEPEDTLLQGQLRQDEKLDRILSLLVDLLTRPDAAQTDLGQRLVEALVLIRDEITAQRRERAAEQKLLEDISARLDTQTRMIAALCHQLATPVA